MTKQARDEFDSIYVKDFVQAGVSLTAPAIYAPISGFVGNTSGTHTGGVLGNVTGDVTGDVSGDVIKQLTTYSADTDLDDNDFPTTYVELLGSTAVCNVSKFTPTVGKLYVFYCEDATNAVTLTTSAGITIDGTNDVATFDSGEMLVVFCLTPTKCLVVANVGPVAFS